MQRSFIGTKCTNVVVFLLNLAANYLQPFTSNNVFGHSDYPKIKWLKL